MQTQVTDRRTLAGKPCPVTLAIWALYGIAAIVILGFWLVRDVKRDQESREILRRVMYEDAKELETMSAGCRLEYARPIDPSKEPDEYAIFGSKAWVVGIGWSSVQSEGHESLYLVPEHPSVGTLVGARNGSKLQLKAVKHPLCQPDDHEEAYLAVTVMP